jgi:hypothetical protein
VGTGYRSADLAALLTNEKGQCELALFFFWFRCSTQQQLESVNRC